MRKRKYVALQHGGDAAFCGASDHPTPQCHNIVSTSQIYVSGCVAGIDLARYLRELIIRLNERFLIFTPTPPITFE